MASCLKKLALEPVSSRAPSSGLLEILTEVNNSPFQEYRGAVFRAEPGKETQSWAWRKISSVA